MIFHLRDTRAGGIPFLFELPLADFQAQFFSTQAFELQGEFFALLGKSRRLVSDGCRLLLKRGFPAFELGTLVIQAHGQSLGGHEPLIQSSELGASGGQRILFRFDSATACFTCIHCSSCITSGPRWRNSRFMPRGPASSGRPPVTMRPW